MTSHERHVVSNHRSFEFSFNSGQISKKRQSPHYWPFFRGMHRWPVNSPHNGPVTRKKLPFDDVITDNHFSTSDPLCAPEILCINRQPEDISLVHYNDVIMGAMESQIISITIVYSIVYSDADQRKHQGPASLAFVRGIHRGPVNSPHKWPVTR